MIRKRKKGTDANFARPKLLNLDRVWGEIGVCPLFLHCCRLKRPRTEQKLDNIALMRLQPVELQRRDRSQIQSIDLRGVDQSSLPLRVLRDGATHQRGTDIFEHLLLRTLDHT